MVVASILSRAVSPKDAVMWASRGARVVGAREERAGAMDVERAVMRWGRVMRWIDCMDRAIAVRWWLAARGQASEIVVGFRRREAWEGHAWLESGERRWFVEVGAGYREVFREPRQASGA